MAYDKTDPNLFNHGFSTDGVVLLAADAKSLDKLQDWHHAATGRLPWFEKAYKEQHDQIWDLLKRLSKEKDKVIALEAKLAQIRVIAG